MRKLSKNAKDKIDEWKQFKEDRVRISWDETFITQAFNVSKRSKDAQTRHGCIIVNQTNEIISTGYNSFVRNIDDDILPNLRDDSGLTPAKYTWLIHAENNAILNACRQGKSTINSKAYVTGAPCINCFQYLYQAGVSEIIYPPFNKSHMMSIDKDYETNVEIFLWLVKKNMTVRILDIEENYIRKFLD